MIAYGNGIITPTPNLNLIITNTNHPLNQENLEILSPCCERIYLG